MDELYSLLAPLAVEHRTPDLEEAEKMLSGLRLEAIA